MIKMLRALIAVPLPAGLTAVLAACLLSACSIWPFHSTSLTNSGDTAAADASALPPLPPNYGRVYFFRMGSYSPDALIHPEIRMDGKIVGVARSGSYFLADLPAGNYSAAATMNMDRPLNVYVSPGRTSYVQVELRFPVLTGRAVLSEVSPRIGVNMISTLDYTGGKN